MRRVAGTVRFRITAVATVALLLVLVVAGVLLIAAQRTVLTENLDETMESRLDQLAVDAREGELTRRLEIAADDDAVAQVVDVGGAVVAATENLSSRPSIAPLPTPGDADDHVGTLPDFDEDGVDYRLRSRVVDIADHGRGVIHTADPLDDIDESVAVLRTSLLVAVPSLAALLATLIWWLVGRTLRPVEAIRAEVAAMSGADVHRRVPVPAGDDEIARLATTMNGMLERVEESSRRQQRFVADASHELRTPLTRIRSEVEVDLAHPGGADLAATHRSVLEEATTMQALVDDLLHVARSDAGAMPVRHDPVALDEVVRRHAGDVAALGRVTVDVNGVEHVRVSGDPQQLGRAVANLADNAARHASRVVRFELAANGTHGVLHVTDDGPGVPAEDCERIFERFTRLDDARAGATGGAGLGLAIARDIVERHGGSVTVDAEHQNGARFVMTIPLAPPS